MCASSASDAHPAPAWEDRARSLGDAFIPSEAPYETRDGTEVGLRASRLTVAIPYPEHMTDDQIALTEARRMLQFSRVARDFFPAMRDLADHPGWEIVLHLFIAGREGRPINTADLSEQTGTWRPLAVRYIEMLFERGLIDRDVTAEKPEAWALSLTPPTEARLRELLCGYSRGFDSANEGGAAT